MKEFKIVVEETDAVQRIDRFLTGKFRDEFSRSFIQKLINGGHVIMNGNPVKNNMKVKAGDAIELTVPPAEKTDLVVEDIPLNIAFEDSHLIIINKPAGMVVHPGAGNATGTMVNALLGHCKALSVIGGEERPGIVHRLDKDTSGLLVVAKDDYTHRKLSLLFQKRKIKRKYIAFVRGVVELDNGTIDLPIGRDKADRQKMAVGFDNAKEAVTHYTVVKRFDDYTMLELVLGTGRTHQIRTHLQYLGHPLLGDKKYGRSSEVINRQALHAAVLGFKHPVSKEVMEFEAELPDDMKKLC